jgi:predicted ATPase
MTPFVGREQEIALLLERWAQAKQGEGQVVQLSSEAGIGKSRMIRTLLERVSAEPLVRLRYQCSPHHVNSALYPFIVQLERAAEIAPADGPEIKLEKLEALLRQGVDDIATAARLLAELLSIPTGRRYAPLELEPQRRKQLTLEALLDQLVGLAAGEPVLVAFEDAHWADPTSLELLEAMVDRIQGARVIAMITHRPEFRAPWAGRGHVTSLALKPLTRKQSAEMVAKLTEGKPVPEPVLAQIVDKTDGMPLFIEELTKEVLEGDLLADAGDRYELHGPLPQLAIPSTLQDSLMARLDRLAPVKEVAQTGAAIGRAFSHELLAAVSPQSEDQLAHALEQLTEFELIFRRGIAPDATYVFKHALVQDAAYESLLKSTRQQLHRRIAQALERDFPDTAETEPEILAHHYTAAELSDQAITYWQKAGERALRRSANVEAINHLNKGLELLKTLPETRKRDERELPLQLTLGPALMAAKGQGASDMRQAYARARVLGLHLGDTREHFRALWGLWRSHFVLSEHDTAQEFGEQCLNVAETSEDVAFGVVARFALGGTLMFKGDFAGARVHLERAIPLYDIEKHRSLGFVYGQDPGPSNLAYLSFTLWYSGFAEQAIKTGREAVVLAKSSNHPLTVAMVQMYLAMSYVFCRDWYAARSQAEIAMELANARGFPQILSLASTIHGRALVEAGDIERGIPQTEQGIATRKAIDVRVARPFELTLLAEAYGVANRNDEGLQVLAEALDFANNTGEGFYLPEVHRLKGELLLQHDHGAAEQAASCFCQALDAARRQQSKPLELRAATSLARLWRDQGKIAEASDLVAPVYGWFTEGFETSDLKDAEALLDELS